MGAHKGNAGPPGVTQPDLHLPLVQEHRAGLEGGQGEARLGHGHTTDDQIDEALLISMVEAYVRAERARLVKPSLERWKGGIIEIKEAEARCCIGLKVVGKIRRRDEMPP